MVEYCFFFLKFLKVKCFFGLDWNYCSSVKVFSQASGLETKA